jgi:DNA-directed RNA polymerase subunit omega
MAQIPFEDLMEHVDSKYRLVMIASKRAKQLNRGAQSLLAPRSVKPTYQALEEVAGGKMGYEIEPLEGAMARELAEAGGKASWYRSLSAEEVAPDEVVVEAEETVEEEEEAPVTPPVTTGTEDLLINEFEEEGLDELEIEPVDGEEPEE